MRILDELRKLTRPYQDDEFIEGELSEPVRAPSGPHESRSYTSYAEPPRSTEGGGARRSIFRAFTGASAPLEEPRAESAAAQPAPSSPFATAPGAAQPAASAGVPREGRVVNFSPSAPTKMLVVKPDRFDSAAEIVDHLRARHAVIINIESTPKDVARRIIDFVYGAVYAQEGRIQKVAVNTFLATPANVDIVTAEAEQYENKGIYF